MNVIAYIRVSTDNQVGEDKFGLDAQREAIKAYCEENGITIVKWVADEGESGAKERPGFDEIIYGDVSNPPFEAVVVAKSDRVARDINVYYYYKMMLRKKSINLISISEDFGAFGVMAGILEAFTVCVAEIERNNITARTSSGRRIKASRGGYSGGRIPTGYKVQNGNLVIVEEEAELVRLIFSLKKSGYSMLKTAEYLNENGYRTKNGGIFYASSVKGILENERMYRGEYRYGGGEWVKGAHEPILK